MTSVLNEWVMKLPLMQQSVLLSALRGPDGVAKHNPAKKLCRYIRKEVCVDAKPSEPHSFMQVEEDNVYEYLDIVLKDIDEYPLHFFLHLIYAFEVIGYKHPDNITRSLWYESYRKIVFAIHLNPETEEELDIRLHK